MHKKVTKVTKSLILFAVIVSILFVSCSNAETSMSKHGVLFFTSSSVEAHTALISLIQSASSEIYLVSPVITNSEVCDALVEMRQKGLSVNVVIDLDNVSHEKILFLSNNNISVHARGFSGKMNSSFALTDKSKAFVGNINSYGKEEISCAVVIQDEEFIQYLYSEFVILNNGVSPSSKDAEFDQVLGPMSTYFSPGWFLTNQININDGSIKGRWPQLTVSDDYFEISPYLSPYPKTEGEYFYYTNNSGIYEAYDNYVSYYDYESSKSLSEKRYDFSNILVQLIDAADKSIIVICTDFSDKRVCHSLISAAGRGVSIEIYADYAAILSRSEKLPLTIDKLRESAEVMTYKTSINGGISENVIIIDDKSFIFSTSPFCSESFIADDSLFWVSSSVKNIMPEFSRQIRQIKMRAVKFDPEK